MSVLAPGSTDKAFLLRPPNTTTELRWCFGEECRGPQPVENFRHPTGKQCKTCYKAAERKRRKIRRRRYRKDPAYRRRQADLALQRWHRINTPEHLAELRLKKKLRYGSDPEYRERMLEHARKWRAKTVPPLIQCWAQSNVTKKRCRRMSHNPDGCQWHRQSREKAA